MAERAGFEPAMGFPIRHFQCRALGLYATSPQWVATTGSVAERVGFEPTVLSHTAFRERHLKPLGHLSGWRV